MNMNGTISNVTEWSVKKKKELLVSKINSLLINTINYLHRDMEIDRENINYTDIARQLVDDKEYVLFDIDEQFNCAIILTKRGYEDIFVEFREYPRVQNIPMNRLEYIIVGEMKLSEGTISSKFLERFSDFIIDTNETLLEAQLDNDRFFTPEKTINL